MAEPDYRHRDFDDLFQKIAAAMWGVKTWDNQAVKDWMRVAFEDARVQNKPPK
jgi:hypothetical protein